jgi:hypothetical protein
MSRRNKPDLTEKRKVQILVDRKMGLDTVKHIAADNDVSENHVYKVERLAGPELHAKADVIVESLLERMQSTRDLALRRIHERLESNDAPLNHITTAFGVVHDKILLEQGKPNQIVQHTSSPEEHAIEFYKILLNKMDQQSALSMFRNSNLAPLVSDHTRDRVALQLESGEVNPDAKPDG